MYILYAEFPVVWLASLLRLVYLHIVMVVVTGQAVLI